MITCDRCGRVVEALAKAQIDPAYPKSKPIEWPIPHMPRTNPFEHCLRSTGRTMCPVQVEKRPH